MRYCLGFMLDETLEMVALIKKLKPPALASLFNGIGGKIEYAELPLDAMIREFKEETGVDHDWWLYAGRVQFTNPLDEMYVYAASTNKVFGVETKEAEEVSLHRVDEVLSGGLKTGPNVKRLLTMSIACFHHPKRIPFDIDIP